IPSRMPSRVAQILLVSGHPEVYEPCDDSFALVDALLADRENLVDGLKATSFCVDPSRILCTKFVNCLKIQN
ncbi:hypothetical protein MKX03_003750, partial [Papaver bracteatum]